MNWDRLEAMGRSLDLDEGVRARIADPLWLLARQWQVGEFRGDDAAQPVSVAMTAETVPLTSCRNGAADPVPTGWQPGDPPGTPPLEALVEAVAPRNGLAGLREAVRIGQDLHDRLVAAGAANVAASLRPKFGFRELPEHLVPPSGRAAAALRLFLRRGIDGRAILDDPDRRIDKVVADLDTRIRPSAEQAVDDWRLANDTAPGPAWTPSRFEYSTSLAGMSAQGEIVVSAAEHPGGHLDWYRFDIGGPRHGLTKDDDRSETRDLVAVPAPVRYSGMPAARWWEMEDRAVHMGDIQSGPGDFARLMVAEFATSYSDDWFLVPLRVRRGALVRVTGLAVHDTFDDDAVKVAPVATVDRARLGAHGGPRGFRLFELGGNPDESAAPWLLIAPTLASSMEGPALEEVEFARDEGANLAWAIERQIEGPLGQPLDRRQTWFARQERRAPDTAAKAVPGLPTWRYRIAAEAPPPWWIPLIPEPAGDGQMRLRRGRMQQWSEMPADQTGTFGTLLGDPDAPFHVEEEEIPRSGITVRRRWQAARGTDGRLYIWQQYTKTPGRGERASGLRWDFALPGLPEPEGGGN